jgi:hypothetical protein
VPPLATTSPELDARIRDAAITVTLNLLNVLTKTDYRYVSQVTHNALTEHLQNLGHKNLIL